MAWVRLDDQFFANPKVVELGKDAKLVYLAALTYCGSQLTDGVIKAGAVRMVAAMVDAERECVAELVDAGLWEVIPEGYRIHDYLIYNPSGEQVKAERANNAKRQQEWRERNRGEAGQFKDDVTPPATNAGRNAVTNASSNTAPYPSRTHPVPVPLPDPVPDPTPGVRAAPKRANAQATLPSAEELIEQLRPWAEERGVREILADEVDRFRDYCLSGKNGRPVTYADYAAGCRKWITNPNYGHTARAPTPLVVNGNPIPANSRTARNIRVLDTPWPEHHRQEDR